MGRARIVVNGLPFTVDGEGTPQQLAGALQKQLTQDPTLFDRRAKQLGLNEDDLLALAGGGEGGETDARKAFQVETSGPTERFLIGAGSTLVDASRGVQQLFTGDEGDAEISRRRANEQELFKQLDDQGIGAEDLGQLAPEVAAFLSSGGLTSLMIRGAGLGFVQPTDGEGGATQRAKSTLLSGVLSAAGPTTTRAISGLFKKGTTAGAGLVNVMTKLAERGKIGNGVAGVASQAGDMLTNSNPAIQKVGRMALDRASDIIQRMNARGKNSVTAGLANEALKKSVREVDGQNVLDFNAFNRELLSVADSTLKRDLGKAFGKQLSDLRKTFDELAGITNLPQKEAQAVLEAVVTRPEAATLAKALTTSKDEVVKTGIAQRLIETSMAVAGQEASDLATAVGTPEVE